jgi:hypothetical protein
MNDATPVLMCKKKAAARQAAKHQSEARDKKTSVQTSLQSTGCACGGSCPRCQAKTNKPNFSQSHDPAEVQADQIADKVMRMPAQETMSASHSKPSGQPIRRKFDNNKDATETIRRKPLASTGGTPTQTPAHVKNAISSGGSPLDQTTRSFFEARFNRDLCKVRVHTDSAAEQSAHDINAKAYTLGHSVVFGARQFAPETHDGKLLLAHELTHVLQQSDSTSVGSHQGNGKDPLVTIGSPMPNTIARKENETAENQVWQDQLNALLPSGGLLSFMLRVQILENMFGPELPSIVAAITADKDAVQFVKDHGNSAILALGETSLAHGTINVIQAKAWLTAQPDRYSIKNNSKLKSERDAMFPDVPGAKIVTYDEALQEGAGLLGKAEFGLSAGSKKGLDDQDGYDAQDWDEVGGRGVLVSKVEPWLAINSIVKNIGKPVKKAGGGTTLWSFDCFDFVTILRIYAYWRSMGRIEFNKKFVNIELGFHGKSPMQWEAIISSEKLGEKPSTAGEVKVIPGTTEFKQERIPTGLTWKQQVDRAPIGTQITWRNTDAIKKCTADPDLNFCAYMFENTTKLGQDRYAAHPMGIVNEKTIKDEMAKAVFEGKPVTPGYIEKNIFVSGMRAPIR